MHIVREILRFELFMIYFARGKAEGKLVLCSMKSETSGKEYERRAKIYAVP